MGFSKRLLNILLALGALAIGAGALLGAFYAADHLRKNNQETWQKNFAETAPVRATQVAKWLDEKLEISARLAGDARIQRSLRDIIRNPDFLVVDPAVDLAIKEFGLQPNGSLDVYIFDNDSRMISMGTKSHDLPLNIRKSLAQAYNTGLNSYITISQVDGQNYLLVTQRVLQAGESLGYVGYMVEARLVFSELKNHPFDTSGLRSLIARRNGDTEALIVSWPGNLGATVRSQTVMGFDIPFFSARDSIFGIYHDETGQPVFAHVENVADYPLWQIAVYINVDYAQRTIENTALAIKGIASLFMLLMITLALGLTRRGFGNKKAPLIPTRTSMKKTADTFRGGFRNYGASLGIFTGTKSRNLNLEGANSSHLEDRPTGTGASPSKKKPAPKPSEDGSEDEKPNTRAGMEKLSRPVSEMDKDDPELVARGQMISQCLEDERIRLYFQPIIDTASNKKVMYETLLRVIDPEGTILMPADVIPVAIKRGFIQQIDDTVIVASIRRHMEIFTQGKRAMLSINLSYGAFSSMKFMEVFMEGMNKGQIRPEYLNFELASREIIEDQRAMGFIKEMREMGCKFSVDYFGGGVKTVEAARQLKFDYMKVDCLKFRGITDGNSQEIAEFREIMLRGQELGLKMIAEKIENKSVWWLCKRLGVPYVQGFYLAEPTPKLDLGW